MFLFFSFNTYSSNKDIEMDNLGEKFSKFQFKKYKIKKNNHGLKNKYAKNINRPPFMEKLPNVVINEKNNNKKLKKLKKTIKFFYEKGVEFKEIKDESYIPNYKNSKIKYITSEKLELLKSEIIKDGESMIKKRCQWKMENLANDLNKENFLNYIKCDSNFSIRELGLYKKISKNINLKGDCKKYNICNWCHFLLKEESETVRKSTADEFFRWYKDFYEVTSS